MYKKTDLIYVKSAKLGPIPPLRMNGPIFAPIKITVETAERCLATRIPLNQIDPITGIAVQLTMENLYDDTKLEKANEAAKKEREGKGMLHSVSPVDSYNNTHSTVSAPSVESPIKLRDDDEFKKAIDKVYSEEVKDVVEDVVEAEEQTNTQQYQSNSKKKKNR